MTNREKLIKTNIYDLLCKMQHNNFNRLDCQCVMEFVVGKEIKCTGEGCDRCIEQWLNEEAKV